MDGQQLGTGISTQVLEDDRSLTDFALPNGGVFRSVFNRSGVFSRAK